MGPDFPSISWSRNECCFRRLQRILAELTFRKDVSPWLPLKRPGLRVPPATGMQLTGLPVIRNTVLGDSNGLAAIVLLGRQEFDTAVAARNASSSLRLGVAVIGVEDQRQSPAFADSLRQAGPTHQIGCDGWIFTLWEWGFGPWHCSAMVSAEVALASWPLWRQRSTCPGTKPRSPQ